MTNIVIKDLKENIELDRKAMQAISGGRSGSFSSAPMHHSSIFINPISFNNLRLFPGSPEPHGGNG
jgi:hypothetical protein